MLKIAQLLDAAPETETISLPSGDRIPVAKFCCEFRKWEGAPIADTYGSKAVLDCDGEPLFAELAVLKRFQHHGWNGAWADSYGRKYRTGLPGLTDPVQLPAEKERLLERIRHGTRRKGGCWDVIVWKDHETLFLELKRRKKDKIQSSRAAWLEAALAEGLSASAFAVIEWDFSVSRVDMESVEVTRARYRPVRITTLFCG